RLLRRHLEVDLLRAQHLRGPPPGRAAAAPAPSIPLRRALRLPLRPAPPGGARSVAALPGPPCGGALCPPPPALPPPRPPPPPHRARQHRSRRGAGQRPLVPDHRPQPRRRRPLSLRGQGPEPRRTLRPPGAGFGQLLDGVGPLRFPPRLPQLPDRAPPVP